jgi:hypothetical protein
MQSGPFPMQSHLCERDEINPLHVSFTLIDCAA